ncbi:hypothetical protein BGW38_001481 [Lunasporangiospora selenospora]|uniref:FAD-binding domain-containing protein n=1 Tax=Lunasporangiospora selenospora TaxID=979761 RepID=A0A9P6FVI5_9FUNG|nr:hypothetical protein BGW38_001481 [Lunasporangiospora selenospora]
MSILQNEHGVMIRCSDNQTHHGDVLVGADGAHSSVRQSLYKRLKQEGSLPSGDDSELSKGFLCMVGTTDALDPERYPCLRDPYAHFSQVIGKNSPYSWSTISVPDNKICWNVVQQLSDSMTFDDIKFRNSEWAPETNQAMIDEVKGFPITIGGTMRDLIDATPANRISKVFLEEKLFETWYSGRTVLIGDGAVNAMQDAVILANCLYDLESVSPESVEAALKDYRDQRYPHVKYQFDASNTNAKVIYGQTWVDRMVRHVVFNYLPKSVQTRNVAKGAGYRPQASFLPLIENRGKSPLLPQKPSRRYQEEQKRMAQLSKEQQQQEEEEEQQQ